MGKFRGSKGENDKAMSLDMDMFSVGNPMQGISDAIIYSGDNEPEQGDEGRLETGHNPVLKIILINIGKRIIRKVINNCCCCCGGGSGSLIDESEIVL